MQFRAICVISALPLHATHAVFKPTSVWQTYYLSILYIVEVMQIDRAFMNNKMRNWIGEVKSFPEWRENLKFSLSCINSISFHAFTADKIAKCNVPTSENSHAKTQLVGLQYLGLQH